MINLLFFPKKYQWQWFFLDTNQQNYNNLGIISDINSNENPCLFTNEHILNEFIYDKQDDINIKSKSNSNDKLNITKSGPKDNKNLRDFEKNKEDKDKVEFHEVKNYSLNYLIRRAKKIVFDTLLKYDNDAISKVYNNNIGYGINIKKILRINHSQIQNTNTNFNKELLKTSQGNIFSSDLSTRYTNYPLNHNKILINKLLNEENVEKRKIFHDLFSMTLLECIENIIEKRKNESLKGIDKYYEKEMIDLDEEEKFKELLNKIINLFKISI